MTLWKWSRTASSNATADSSCPWPEGMAPSQVNDSARGNMAAMAKYRDDIAGAILTTGTATAYAVSSYQVFDTLAHLDGAMIAFTPHTTSGAAVTLNVDGLGAKPLRSAPSADLAAGVLIQGTPYVAVYNNTDSAWYLHGLYGNPYNVPLAAGMDYWGSTTPNSAFAFPTGQAISRTTYAALFNLIGTTYGSGDGSTTFNLPDKTERVSVMKASTASRLTSSYFGGDSTVLGAVGGNEKQTLTQGQLPAVSPTFTGTPGTVSVTSNRSDVNLGGGTPGVSSGGLFYQLNAALGSLTSTGSFTPQGTISSLGSGQAHPIVQPTIICNYILRVI